jgi:hypothetical protein
MELFDVEQLALESFEVDDTPVEILSGMGASAVADSEIDSLQVGVCQARLRTLNTSMTRK